MSRAARPPRSNPSRHQIDVRTGGGGNARFLLRRASPRQVSDRRLVAWGDVTAPSNACQLIISQSPVRIRPPPLQPHGSETIATVGFCFAPSERRGELSPGFAGVCHADVASGDSLPTLRATRRIHTLGHPTPHFPPKVSHVSQSRAAWVKRCWLPFRSQPPWVAFGKRTQLQTKMRRVMSSSRREFLEGRRQTLHSTTGLLLAQNRTQQKAQSDHERHKEDGTTNVFQLINPAPRRQRSRRSLILWRTQEVFQHFKQNGLRTARVIHPKVP
jgi:hypothetical protein